MGATCFASPIIRLSTPPRRNISMIGDRNKKNKGNHRGDFDSQGITFSSKRETRSCDMSILHPSIILKRIVSAEFAKLATFYEGRDFDLT